MRKYFLLCINNSTTNKISNIFLTVVHIVIHNGANNGKLEILHLKLQSHSENCENIISTYFIS